MPKFQFYFWEETKSVVQFEADDLEHAKKLFHECDDVDELPESEKFFKKGSEDWDSSSLEEVPAKEDQE